MVANNQFKIIRAQPFKALINNAVLSQYNIFWQVDGGQLNLMNDNNQTPIHKESLVDVSGWSWKGNGPYTINFISKDLSGNVLSQYPITIFVSH